jgi:hypothetical protein
MKIHRNEIKYVISLPSKTVNKGLVIGVATAGLSTFFLSILVLIFTAEFAIKISCDSSGTPVYRVNVARSLEIVLIRKLVADYSSSSRLFHVQIRYFQNGDTSGNTGNRRQNLQ